MTPARCLFVALIVLIVVSPTMARAGEDPDQLYRQGRYAEAEKIYAKMDMDHPKDIRFRYNRGCAAFQKADYEGAVAAFSSVMRRAENDATRFRTAYNLGNTAFQQGDFASASGYYRLALSHDSSNVDARYNLELALRKLDQQKKEQTKGNEQQPGREKGEGEKNKDSSGRDEAGKDQPSPEKNADKKSSSEKDRKPGKEKTGRDEQSSKDKDAKQERGQNAASEQPRDLTGDLKTIQELPENGPENKSPEQTALSIDKRMAEALLNNVREDRSRLLRRGEGKRRAVRSGKDW